MALVPIQEALRFRHRSTDPALPHGGLWQNVEIKDGIAERQHSGRYSGQGQREFRPFGHVVKT